MCFEPFPPDVRRYLETMYLTGDKTSPKADPVQVVADIRTPRNENSDRLIARQ